MKKIILLLIIAAFASVTFGQKNVEEIRQIDYETFFTKILGIDMSTWKYKGEDLRHYGLQPEELLKYFGVDQQGYMANKDGLTVDNQIGLNLTAVWVIAKMLEKTIEENNMLRGELQTLQNDFTHIQTISSDVMMLMQEFNKISEIETKLNEIKTNLTDIQIDLNQLKEKK